MQRLGQVPRGDLGTSLPFPLELEERACPPKTGKRPRGRSPARGSAGEPGCLDDPRTGRAWGTKWMFLKEQSAHRVHISAGRKPEAVGTQWTAAEVPLGLTTQALGLTTQALGVSLTQDRGRYILGDEVA